MTDKDLKPIQHYIEEYLSVHQQYVDTKLRLIKQNDLPFDPNEFLKPTDQLKNQEHERA